MSKIITDINQVIEDTEDLALKRELERQVKIEKTAPARFKDYEAAITTSEPWNLSDHILCANVRDVLQKTYRDWFWHVWMERKVLYFRSVALAPGYIKDPVSAFKNQKYKRGQWMMRVKPDDIDNDYHKIKELGGELLERFGMPRKAFKQTYIEQAERDDFDGSMVMDTTGAKTDKLGEVYH